MGLRSAKLVFGEHLDRRSRELRQTRIVFLIRLPELGITNQQGVTSIGFSVDITMMSMAARTIGAHVT